MLENVMEVLGWLCLYSFLIFILLDVVVMIGYVIRHMKEFIKYGFFFDAEERERLMEAFHEKDC